MSGARLQESVRVVTSYFRRSWDYVKNESIAGVQWDNGWKKEMPMFDFTEVEKLEDWIVGSDADIGGLSEAYWGFTPENTALFWGNISTEIPAGVKLERSGYAGIRSKERPRTLFHRPRFDTSYFRYLAIRARGDTRQWFVNLQTETIFPSYLWQHRLYFQNPGEWETVLVPFRDFVLTAHGFVQQRQLVMNRTKVKTVGFSIVRQPGPFQLEIDWIKAVNTPRTLGDHDLLGAGEYMDQDGKLKKLKPGEDLRDALGTRVKIFTPGQIATFNTVKKSLGLGKKGASVAPAEKNIASGGEGTEGARKVLDSLNEGAKGAPRILRPGEESERDPPKILRP
ncbi:hypothetical protein HDV00_009157 [Rhizophlyctis rosea]|nr:hypothetical protein HDV00_009157 [Rhizophlyctis rosea]